MKKLQKSSRWLIYLSLVTVVVVVICATIMVSLLKGNLKSKPASRDEKIATLSRESSSRTKTTTEATASNSKTEEPEIVTETTAAPDSYWADDTAESTESATTAAAEEEWAAEESTTTSEAPAELPAGETSNADSPGEGNTEQQTDEYVAPEKPFTDYSAIGPWLNNKVDENGTINLGAAISEAGYSDLGATYGNGYYVLQFEASRITISYDGEVLYERLIGNDGGVDSYNCQVNNGLYYLSHDDLDMIYYFVSSGSTSGFRRLA